MATMPLPDEVLELLFSFLLEKRGRTGLELQLAAQPVCRLLQTRRMRGFEHVTLEVCRRGLGWAMGGRTFFEQAARQLTSELRRRESRNRPAPFEALEPSPWLPRLRRRDEPVLVWNV